MSISKEPFTLLAQYKNFVPKHIEDAEEDDDVALDQMYEASSELTLDSLSRFLFGLVSVLIGIGLGLAGARMLLISFVADQQYSKEGQAIIATVTECHMQKASKTTDEQPVVTYEYMLLDILYIAEEGLTGRSCDRYPTGMSLQGQYLASDPSNSRITQEGIARHGISLIILGGTLFCLVLGGIGSRELYHNFYALHNHASVHSAVPGQPHRTLEPLPSYVTSPSRWLLSSLSTPSQCF